MWFKKLWQNIKTVATRITEPIIALFIALWTNIKAEVSRVVSIIIALFVAGVLLPIALTQLATGNYTSVNPAVKTIATVLLPILAIIAIVYIFLKKK